MNAVPASPSRPLSPAELFGADKLDTGEAVLADRVGESVPGRKLVESLDIVGCVLAQVDGHPDHGLVPVRLRPEIGVEPGPDELYLKLLKTLDVGHAIGLPAQADLNRHARPACLPLTADNIGAGQRLTTIRSAVPDV